MRTATYCLVAAVLVFAVRVQAEERKDAAAQDLTGMYKVTAVTVDGKAEQASDFRDAKVEITRNAITWVDKDGKKSITYFKVANASQKPWSVQLTPTEGERKGKTLMGIMEKDGNTLRLSYNTAGDKAPVSFKGGEKQKSFTLERIGGGK